MVTPIRAAGPVAAVLLVGLVGVDAPSAPDGLPPADAARAGTVVGLGGCAGTACHGRPASDRDAPAWQTATAVWFAADPHRRAYAALDTRLAREMAERLAGPGGKVVAATEDARCLACHTTPALADGAATPERVALRAEGASCEACHGPAGGWLRPHTTWATPDARLAGCRERGGLVDLNDPGARALACLGCHVGAPADPARGLPLRDMNHDMIAAGHPRLNFDYADYLDRLPRHWQEKERSKSPPEPRGPEFGVTGWLVGRVAHAEAACRLLEDRARRAAPWPEFAEFNCFACHHDLRPDGWREPGPGRPPGTLPWQTIWPVTGGTDTIAGVLSVMEGRREPGDLRRSRPPRAADAETAAKTAAEKLEGVRRSLAGVRPADVPAVFRDVRADRLDWDEAGQVVQGLAALERFRVRKTPGPVHPAFAPAYAGLALPRPVGKERFDSPAGYDPAKVRAAIEALVKDVPAAAEKELK